MNDNELPGLKPREDKDLVVLLDLNYTLCGNSPLKKTQRMDYHDKIGFEEYRHDLWKLVKGHTVLLCTVRKTKYEAVTIARIREMLGGWEPDGWYFNTTESWDGGIVKRQYLLEQIFPKYGSAAETDYYAAESAMITKRMYSKYFIPADSYPKQGGWLELPWYTHAPAIKAWKEGRR